VNFVTSLSRSWILFMLCLKYRRCVNVISWSQPLTVYITLRYLEVFLQSHQVWGNEVWFNFVYHKTLQIVLFLAHLSWKLKWAILIARCPSVRLSVCKLLHFWLLLQNHWANFNQTWHKSSLGGGILNCSSEGDCLSPRGDNSKRVKIHWKFLKIFFSRTSWPISIKLRTNHP
jgi:hypothetical protein